jgi:hypothetical protein
MTTLLDCRQWASFAGLDLDLTPTSSLRQVFHKEIGPHRGHFADVSGYLALRRVGAALRLQGACEPALSEITEKFPLKSKQENASP